MTKAKSPTARKQFHENTGGELHDEAVLCEADSAFPVDIDASQSVGDLKDGIKAKNEDITVPARTLQVFLARKQGDSWLDVAGAADVVIDEHGHPQGFAKMNPLLWIDNANHFGKDFTPREGELHVLVVVPKQASKPSPERAPLEVMLPFVLTHASTTTTQTERNSDFKKQLCQFYGCYDANKSYVRCMLLNVAFPKQFVLASHLFRRSNEHLAFAMVQLSNIDDVKNGLLLFTPLKHALDAFQISFLRDATDDTFRLKLFDPNLRHVRLIDLTDRYGHEVLSTVQKKVFHQSIASFKKKRCRFRPETTFGDVDGKTLTHWGGATILSLFESTGTSGTHGCFEEPMDRCLV